MQAATKYIGGHSDIMFGTISANAKAWPLIAETIFLLGVCAGVLMFISKATNYYNDEFFRYKMLFILLAGLNMAIFHLFTFKSVAHWDRDVPTLAGAKIAGGLSTNRGLNRGIDITSRKPIARGFRAIDIDPNSGLAE